MMETMTTHDQTNFKGAECFQGMSSTYALIKNAGITQLSDIISILQDKVPAIRAGTAVLLDTRNFKLVVC